VVPTTGEKVRCPGCGQKFRFDTVPRSQGESPGAEEIEVGGGEADTIGCPRCGNMVAVPKTGEKVRCPGCGQKFRYEVKAGQGAAPEGQVSLPPPLPAQAPGGAEDEPPSSETEEVEEAEVEPPRELAPSAVVGPPSMSLANEMRTLWLALSALVERVYEDGKASEGDRVRFREEAQRAAELAQEFVPLGEAENQTARELILNVLPTMSLDEVTALSLEDFRHLREAFEEARELLEARLPGPPLGAARPATPAPQAPPVAVRPRPVISTPAVVALTVFFGLLVVLVLNLPEIKRRLDALSSQPTKRVTIIREVEKPPSHEVSSTVKVATGDRTVDQPQGGQPTPEPRERKPPERVEIPVFEGKQPEAPSTPARPSRKPTTEVVVVEKPVRVASRWRAGRDGWIVVFRGSRPEGVELDPTTWTFERGLVIGRATRGVALARMVEASWTDYTLEAELRLGRQGAAIVAHGSLTAILGDKRVRLLNAGRLLDELNKGLARDRWYRVVLEVAGPKAEVRINDKRALATSAFEPVAGPPTIGARDGAVAFRSMRVRLHPTDSDYRAVVLGEGYVRPPRPTPTPETLGPGTYRLFNGRDLSGWRQDGRWGVSSGAIVGGSPNAVPATLIGGSTSWADYTLSLGFRIVRESAVPREDEYALVIFRARDARNFHCVRFAVEGLYELGYYRNGRFHETSRARFGLGSRSRFNRWRSLRLTVRGAKLTLSIDGVGGMPPWPITTFANGAVGVGVTGGQAAFRDISVEVYR